LIDITQYQDRRQRVRKRLHAHFRIFPHNIAPDFLQYISGESKSENAKTMKV
jgi:hypothetical protein